MYLSLLGEWLIEIILSYFSYCWCWYWVMTNQASVLCQGSSGWGDSLAGKVRTWLPGAGKVEMGIPGACWADALANLASSRPLKLARRKKRQAAPKENTQSCLCCGHARSSLSKLPSPKRDRSNRYIVYQSSYLSVGYSLTWSPRFSPASAALLPGSTTSTKTPNPFSLPPVRLKCSGDSRDAFCSTTCLHLAFAAQAMFSNLRWPFIFCEAEDWGVHVCIYFYRL